MYTAASVRASVVGSDKVQRTSDKMLCGAAGPVKCHKEDHQKCPQETLNSAESRAK